MTTNSQGRLKKGSLLGTYRIVRLIGMGSMGEVYEAFDAVLERKVALKVILPEHYNSPEIAKRFMIEGQALAKLSHGNVVSVYALGEDEGNRYLVMEFVDGIPLWDLLQAKSFLAPKEALKYFVQLLRGVKALHEHGILHRDIKPKNTIIRKDDSVKIVDFGIAKVKGHPDKEITATGAMVGSLYYIAPEVLEGEPSSAQSDIWSLGINLYEMLTGQKPFQDDNRMALIRKITEDQILFPKNHQIPEALQMIIVNMCAKSPYRRYASIDEILRDIDSFKAGNPVRPLRTTMLTPDSEVILKTEKKSGPKVSEPPVLIPQPAAKIATASVAEEPKRFRNFAIAGFVALGLLGTISKLSSAPSTPPQQEIASETEITTTTLAISEPVQAPVVANVPPELLEPGNDFEAIEESNLLFSWVPKFGNTTYRFQISREIDFQQLILDQQVQTVQLNFSGLPSGVYFWRVRTENSDPNALWSQVRTFHLKSIQQPILAKNVTPPPVPLPVKSPVAKTPVAQSKTPPPQAKLPIKFQPPTKKLAATKSKTASTSKRERRTASSAQEVYTLPVPKLRMPASGSSFTSLPGSKSSVLFRWENVPTVETYGLEISTDEQFTQPLYSLSSETNQLNVSRTFLKGKVLYWRVQSRRGLAKSKWSKPFVIKIRPN